MQQHWKRKLIKFYFFFYRSADLGFRKCEHRLQNAPYSDRILRRPKSLQRPLPTNGELRTHLKTLGEGRRGVILMSYARTSDCLMGRVVLKSTSLMQTLTSLFTSCQTDLKACGQHRVCLTTSIQLPWPTQMMMRSTRPPTGWLNATAKIYQQVSYANYSLSGPVLRRK